MDNRDNYHYFFLDKRIGFKADNIENINNEIIFPDESEFNKNSNISESEYIDINEKTDLGRYFRCGKEQINNTLIFVFYLKDENNTNLTEEFWVERVKYNEYLKEEVLNIKLEPLQYYLYKIPSKYNENKINTFFTTSPYSILFLRQFNENIVKFQSNINLYFYRYHEYFVFYYPRVLELFFVIYNPDNFTRNIILEYKNAKELYSYRSWSIDYFFKKDFVPYLEHISLVCVFGDEPGLFNISNNANKYLFTGNIENVKNLTDLKYNDNYKLITNGIIYSPKPFIILLINDIGSQNGLYVTSPSIEDKGTEVSDLNFTYFKITQNNSLTITSKYPEQPYIIKLISDKNGTLIINNQVYNFTQEEIKIIEPNQKLNIISINNNLILAIKLKIVDSLIEYGKIGKQFNFSNNIDYKFIIFKLDNLNNSMLNIYISHKDDIFYNYGIVNDLNEIQKKNAELAGYFFLDLKYYKKFKSCYFFIYFENITVENKVTIELTKYQIFPSSHNTFNLVQGNDFIINNYGVNNAKFSIIPCFGNCMIEYRGYYGWGLTEDYNPFKQSFRLKETDFIMLNTTNSFSFINYYQDNNDLEDYSFEGNLTSIYPFIPSLANMTHLRLIFYELFSNAPEINYIFVISKDENHENDQILEPLCIFFYNFYLKNQSNTEELQIYYFSLNDVKKNETNTYYVDFPFPSKLNIFGSNNRLKFKLMGVTGPKYKYIKIYNTIHLNISLCHINCNECKYMGDDNNQNCTSCNITSKNKYLVESKQYESNCVEECPKDTILDIDNYKCIDKKKDNDNNGKKYLYIIFGSIVFAIILIIGIIISFKIRRTKKEKIFTQNIKEMNSELMDY